MAAKASGLTLDQVAAAAGVSERLVRHWVYKKTVPSPIGHRYGEEHVLKARATNALLRNRMTLAEVKQWMRDKTNEEIATWLSGAPAKTTERAKVAFPATRFERVALAKGLELVIADDAAPGVRRLAEQIFRDFGPGEAT